MKESSTVEIIWNEEDKVIDPSLHEEVIQLLASYTNRFHIS